MNDNKKLRYRKYREVDMLILSLRRHKGINIIGSISIMDILMFDHKPKLPYFYFSCYIF